MTLVLVRKLLRDLRLAWLVAAILLFLFQLLWSRITQQVTSQILEQLAPLGVKASQFRDIIFDKNQLPGKLVQAVIGGDRLQPDHAQDIMTIAYVHPLVITILCIWAIGRAANAIAGEIDRGTMELLLAQPIRRTQIILAHLIVDGITFPALCLVVWSGTYCGTWMMGLQDAVGTQQVLPRYFFPALACMLGLLFSVSGMTMWMSSMGRSRPRVWGFAISFFLVMFLANVLGQIWVKELSWIRPWTLFYHYQPQAIILNQTDKKNANGESKDSGDKKEPGSQEERKDGPKGSSTLAEDEESTPWQHLLALAGAGLGGYLLAWITFCRRDLPAPL
jgi:ABC-2 type transport system permease protein